MLYAYYISKNSQLSFNYFFSLYMYPWGQKKICKIQYRLIQNLADLPLK